MAGLAQQRVPRWASIVGALAIVAGACSSAPSSLSPSGPATTAGTPSTVPTTSVDTSQLIILTSSLGNQQWDPALTDSGTAPIKEAIGESLIRENRVTRAYEPGLALSWDAAADGLTLDIKLRPNIPFQDGWGTVTADDVKFSIVEYLGPTSTKASQAKSLLDALDNDPAKNVEVVGPLELKLHSTHFVAGELPALADGAASNTIYIQSKKYWTEKPAEALVHPVGTGPYKFVSSTPGTEVKLTAVDAHWRQTATFKNVTFKIIPDDAARLAQVESGAADMAVLPGNLVREAKTKPNLKIFGVADVATMAIALGGQYPGFPYDDPTAPWIQRNAPEKGLAIRQALSLAIDRPTILDAVLAGQGTLTTGVITQFPKIPERNLPGWTLPTFDVNLAKQKLTEGGYPNGFTITMQEFDNRPGSGQADVAEAVAGMWEAIGITVKRVTLTDDQSDEYVGDPPKTQGVAWNRLDSFNELPLQTYLANYNPDGKKHELYDPLITQDVPLLEAERDPVAAAKLDTDIDQKLTSNFNMLPLFTIDYSVVVGPKVGHWDNLTGSGYVASLESVTP